MSVRSDVLLWAQRVVARRDVQPHQLLEIEEHAELRTAQEAFHKIARVAHPDLHRGSLTEEDLELVAAAYARVAAAYQALRDLTALTGHMPQLQPDPPPPRTRTSSTSPVAPRTRGPSTQPFPSRTPPPSTRPFPPRAGTSPGTGIGTRTGAGTGTRTGTGTGPGTGVDAPANPLAAGSSPDALKVATPGGISPKALLHYRRAELSLRRGELKEAVLLLKLAIASDPHSAFLRSALAEVQAVVGK